MSHLFCPIYKLLILGELGGVMRSFLSGSDTREGGEPDNWGTLSWDSSKSTDAEAEVSGDPRRTSYNTILSWKFTTYHYRVAKNKCSFIHQMGLRKGGGRNNIFMLIKYKDKLLQSLYTERYGTIME
jgi:hypothetical protein